MTQYNTRAPSQQGSVVRADGAEIRRALTLLLLPGQVTELRALEATDPDFRKPHTVAGYFDKPDALAGAAVRLTAKGVYFVPNPVNRDLLARAVNRAVSDLKPLTGDGDIVKRRWLLIDADAVRAAGISSTDAEHAAALDVVRTIAADLSKSGWPDPILADSGNGGHLLCAVDLPAVDGGLVARVLETLAFRYDTPAVIIDRKVFNPARIWKLYGTVACKGDSTPERPHRLSRILHAPATIKIVPKEMLEALAATLPKAPLQAARAYGGTAFNLDSWIAAHLPDAVGPAPWNKGRRWILPVCPWKGEHTNGAAYIVQFENGAIAAGCHHNGCHGRDWRALRDLLEPGRQGTRGASLAGAGKDLPGASALVSGPGQAPGGDSAGVKELQFEVQRAGRRSVQILVRSGGGVVHQDTIRIGKANDREKFAAVVNKLTGHAVDEIEKRLSEIAADDFEAQTAVKPATIADTTERCIEFLKTFKFTYRTTARRLFSEAKGCAYAPAEFWTLPGAIEFTKTLPAFLELHDPREKTAMALARDVFRAAGTELWSRLPDREPDKEDIAALQDAIVGCLGVPRTFYSAANVPANSSYAQWLAALEPSESWRRCYGHDVFGRTAANGSLRLAVIPAFLFEKCAKLKREFVNTSAAGRALLNSKITTREALTIRCDGRVIKVWELAGDVISEAAGTTESEAQHDANV